MTIDAQILKALREVKEGSVSGTVLAQQLGISRAAIWARIADLRALGYDIEAGPHFGYRLRSAPDLLLGDDLVARITPTQIIGRDIQVFQETTSTNNIAEKLARDGVKEGAVIFAEYQTHGRGRLGRRWVSPKGKGLWFSVLLRPPFRPEAATQLTIVAATSLVRAIRQQTALDPKIKWPNDVLINGKKVAGILTELSADLDTIKYAILGIGVDVNLNADDFPGGCRARSTSLNIETGGKVNRSELAVAILLALDQDYSRILHGRFEAVADEWEENCVTLGREVAIQIGPRRLQGRAESLTAEGALLLRSQHGHLERIVGGDVIIEATESKASR